MRPVCAEAAERSKKMAAQNETLSFANGEDGIPFTVAVNTIGFSVLVAGFFLTYLLGDSNNREQRNNLESPMMPQIEPKPELTLIEKLQRIWWALRCSELEVAEKAGSFASLYLQVY